MNFILGILLFNIGGIFGYIWCALLSMNSDKYYTIADEDFRPLTEEEQKAYLEVLEKLSKKTGRNLFDMESEGEVITTIKARNIGKLKTKIYLDDESEGE